MALPFPTKGHNLPFHLTRALGSPVSHPLEDDLFDFSVCEPNSHCPGKHLEFTNYPEEEDGTSAKCVLLMLQTVPIQVSLCYLVEEGVQREELEGALLNALLLLSKSHRLHPSVLPGHQFVN